MVLSLMRGKMMKILEKIANKIPLWVYNLIGLVSGIVGLLSPVWGVILYFTGQFAKNNSTHLLFVVLSISYIATIIGLIIKLKKYRAVMSGVIQSTSEGFYHFLHESRDTLFSVLKYKKTESLNVHLLNEMVERYCKDMLDELCKIIKSLTDQEVSACIKIIVPENGNDEIRLKDAKVKTFVRSRNTDSGRQNNAECSEYKRIPKIMDNSDFRDILDPDSPTKKAYFYKKSLIEYAEEEKKHDRSYDNTTKNWEKYYRSAIVVPIRIKHEYLYFSNKDKYYHVIGFLCVDSLSEDAFLEKQERYNVNMVKAFAAEAYVILSKYQFYLEKIEKEEKENVEKVN